MFRKFVVLALLAPHCFATACDNSSIRKVSGAEPLASKLYSSAQEMPMGAWNTGQFETEEFNFLGTTRVQAKPVHVVYLTTIWGAACRATNRLIFFTEDLKPAGQYAGISKPVLEGNTLSFSPSSVEKSVVDLSLGLPSTINGGDDYYLLEGSPDQALLLDD